MASSKRQPIRALFAEKGPDGLVRIDGEQPGPWLRAFTNTIVVCCDTVKGSDLVSLMTHPEDTATGNPGNVMGVTLRTMTGGSVKVMRLSDTWGPKTTTAKQAQDALTEIREACEVSGVNWRPTAAATAMGIVTALAPGIGPASPPRFRFAFYAAIHSGPMIHVSGGCKHGAHIDRNKAYLYEMCQPMPTGAPYIHDGSGHLDVPCIVRARVTVRHTDHTNQLPPLPVSTKLGRVVYPVGTFDGIWPSTMLVPAIERGEVTIDRIYWSIRWSGWTRALEPVAQRMAALPKVIGKPMYTRVWGKFCSQGGWTGRLGSDDVVPGLGLRWRCNNKPQDSNAFPGTHRPDIAAWIVGRNHAAMVSAVRETQPETLVAAHVDALWTSDVKAAHGMVSDKLGGWKLEGTGAIRYYSQGRYMVFRDDGTVKLGCSGWDADELPTPRQLHQWASVRREKADVRGWIERPETTIRARSVAPDITGQEYQVVGGFTPDTPNVWGRGGQFAPGFAAFLQQPKASGVCKHGLNVEECNECL